MDCIPIRRMVEVMCGGFTGEHEQMDINDMHKKSRNSRGQWLYCSLI
jgi:hypothetical protein